MWKVDRSGHMSSRIGLGGSSVNDEDRCDFVRKINVDVGRVRFEGQTREKVVLGRLRI